MNLLALAVKITCQDEASGKIDGIAGKITSGLGGAAKAAAATVGGAVATAAGGITAITTQATNAFANYEQLVGGVNKLFGDSASSVIANAEKAYTTAGVSANDYMEQVTSFSASLISSLGDDTAAAASYADMAVRDMSDNANTFGTDINSIQWAYQGFAKQNYTMLDNLKLGYGGTKEEMERLISDANAVKQANGEMADLSIDSFADVVEAIHTMQDQMGIAGTTEKEALATIEGSVNSAKAAWENWLTALGTGNADLGEQTNQLVDSVVAAANNIIPRVEEILTSLGAVVSERLPEIVTLFTEMATSIVETAAPIVVQLATTLIEQIPTIIDALLQIINALIAALTENAPMIMETITSVIAQVITLIAENLPQFVQAGIQLLQSLIQGIIEALPQIIEAALTLITSIIDTLTEALPQLAEAGVQLLTALVQELPTIIEAIVSKLPQIIESLVTFFTTAMPQIIQAGVELLSALVDNLPTIISAIVTALPEIISAIVEALGNSIPQIVQAGVQLLTALVQNLPEIISGIVSAIPEILSSIVQCFADGVDLMLDAGANLLWGIADGIANAARDVIGSILDVCGNIWNGVLGFFGIASPSKLFAEIGDNLMRGMEKGIDRNADLPVDAMENVADAVDKAAHMEADVSIGDGEPVTRRSFVFDVTINADDKARGRSIAEALYSEMQRMELNYS